MRLCWRSRRWKVKAGRGNKRSGAARTNTGAVDSGVLIYADPRIGVELRPPTPDQPAFLQLEFSEPFEARSLAAYGVPLPDAPPPSHEHKQTPIWLEVSDDGVQFRKVCDLDWGDSGPESVEFPAYGKFPGGAGEVLPHLFLARASALPTSA